MTRLLVHPRPVTGWLVVIFVLLSPLLALALVSILLVRLLYAFSLWIAPSIKVIVNRVL